MNCKTRRHNRLLTFLLTHHFYVASVFNFSGDNRWCHPTAGIHSIKRPERVGVQGKNKEGYAGYAYENLCLITVHQLQQPQGVGGNLI